MVDPALAGPVPRHLADFLRAGEPVEMSATFKRGAVTVTPQRVLVLNLSDGGNSPLQSRSVHVVDRRSVNSIVWSFGWNVAQVIFGVLVMLGGTAAGLAMLTSNNQVVGVLIGICAVALGVVIIYYARTAAFKVGGDSVPIDRTEHTTAEILVKAFAATINPDSSTRREP